MRTAYRAREVQATKRQAILRDACTTVDEMIHKFALGAMATRLKLATASDAIGA